jgi:hypothetical protein
MTTARLIRGVRAIAAAALVVVVAAMAGEAGAQPAPGRPAPELAAGKWINSTPLSIEGLRGRVVAVEFWTFG